MDIGNPDFRFTKLYQNDTRDEREGKPQRAPAYVELHLDSLDRYHDIPGGVNVTQETAKLSGPQVNRIDFSQNGNNFTVATRLGSYLLNGYFTRIGLAQLQLFYRVPTVVSGVNNQLAILYGPPPATVTSYIITIPPGFYTPATLTTALQVALRAATGNNAITCVANALTGGITIATNTVDVIAFQPGPAVPAVWTEDQFQLYYRTARLFCPGRITYGFPTETAALTVFQTSINTFGFNLLYTDYIDVQSDTLTKYKRVKDTNSTDAKETDIIARLYLCPQDTLQLTGNGATFGSQPFVMTTAFKNINWCKWSPEQALEQIDIKLLDMFGNILPWTTANNTEVQITFLASET